MQTIEVTIDLPEEMDQMNTLEELFAVENLRQIKFDLARAFLKTCVFKFVVDDIVTGDTYQSVSKLRAVTQNNDDLTNILRICDAYEVRTNILSKAFDHF